MKKLYLFVWLLMLPLGLSAADLVPILVVQMKDNSANEFLLADKPQVTFKGKNLVVTSDKVTAELPIADVLRFTYVKRDASGIDDLTGDKEQTGVSLSDGGVLTVSSLPANAVVSVYAMDGKLLRQLTAQHAGTYRISLSQLTTGVYLVKTGTLTFKITKR